MRYYDPQHNRLIYIEQAASAEFWDQLWQNNFGDRLTKLRQTRHTFVSDITKRYLKPTDGRILEGGCGQGQQVAALVNNGYDCIGVDFAEATVKAVREVLPDLPVYPGDITRLAFDDGAFSGYWSLGVIEHFWQGYQPIVHEMARVLKPGGYLFLTFPYMSPLRRLKAQLGQYPVLESVDEPAGFYQFALDHHAAIKDFTSNGFRLVKTSPLAGLRGGKDEIAWGRQWLRDLYDYRGKSLWRRGVRFGLEQLMLPVASHSILLVLQRTGEWTGERV